MAFSTRHRFNGEINNVHIKDIKLDYEKETLEERLNEVLKIMDLGIFEEYTDEFYMVSLSKSDETSLNHEVFRKEEQIANYLLGSKEIREERQETQYKFYTNEEEFKLRTKREDNIGQGCSSEQDIEEIIHFLMAFKKNHKKEKNKTLARVDSVLNKNTGRYEDVSMDSFLKTTNDEYAKEVIGTYNDFYKKIEKILKGQVEYTSPKEKINRFTLTKTMKGLERDMIDTHDSLLGSFGQVLRNPLQESTVTNWDSIDLTNPKHIRPLLFVNKTKITPDDDLGLIVYDLNKVIKSMNKEHKEYKEKTGMNKRGLLTNAHLSLIQMIRQGYGIDEISKIIGTSQENVTLTLDKISLNIANYHRNILED